MQITKAGEYGVLGLLALARRPVGEVVMVDLVAAEEELPVSFLGKIFQSLARAGIVKSARGSGGGFTLSREPREISILQVIEAIEGPIALQRCLDEEAGCEHITGCALCGLLAEAQDRVKEVFHTTTLAELSGRHLPAGLMKMARTRGGAVPSSTAAVLTSVSPSAAEPIRFSSPSSMGPGENETVFLD